MTLTHDRSTYRRYVRDLSPGESVPEHPAAARGYGYLVEEVTFATERICNEVGGDVDDAARAATITHADGDSTLAYLLALHWASQEYGGGPLEYSDAVDVGDTTGFVPGTLIDNVYTYELDGEESDGDVERLRYELIIDDEFRERARKWYERHVTPQVRQLVEVMV